MIFIFSLFVFFFSACSSESTSTSDNTPEVYVQNYDTDNPNAQASDLDTLHVLTQTLGIGFSVTDLIVVDKKDSSALFEKLEDILFEFESSFPTQRAIELVKFYAKQNPDVIALQELTQMRQNGSLISDFPNEILMQLNKDSAIYTLFYQPLNRLDLQVLKNQGDTLSNGTVLSSDTLLDIDFNEGNALYVKNSLAPQILEETLYDNKVSFPFLEGDFISERGFQFLSLKKGDRNFHYWNTHLEISDNGLASYSKNQATELLLDTRDKLDTSVTQIISGNFNFKPGLGAHQILTAYPDFIDLSIYGSSETLSNTCCLDLLNGDDYTSRQVDYIFARHFYKIAQFNNRLNDSYLISNQPYSFLPATHSVIETFIVVD